jgi:phage terminase large subunit-like protein
MYLSGNFAHGGNALWRWMATNLVATQDPAGNMKPDRDKSTEKIDGMVALLMAIGRATAGASNEHSQAFVDLNQPDVQTPA